jgi:hypothetical protein
VFGGLPPPLSVTCTLMRSPAANATVFVVLLQVVEDDPIVQVRAVEVPFLRSVKVQVLEPPGAASTRA